MEKPGSFVLFQTFSNATLQKKLILKSMTLRCSIFYYLVGNTKPIATFFNKTTQRKVYKNVFVEFFAINFITLGLFQHSTIL